MYHAIRREDEKAEPNPVQSSSSRETKFDKYSLHKDGLCICPNLLDQKTCRDLAVFVHSKIEELGGFSEKGKIRNPSHLFGNIKDPRWRCDLRLNLREALPLQALNCAVLRLRKHLMPYVGESHASAFSFSN